MDVLMRPVGLVGYYFISLQAHGFRVVTISNPVCNLGAPSYPPLKLPFDEATAPNDFRLWEWQTYLLEHLMYWKP